MSIDTDSTADTSDNTGGERAGETVEVNLAERDPSKAVTTSEDKGTTPTTEVDTRRGRGDSTDSIGKRIGRLRNELSREFNQQLADQQAEFQRQLRERDDRYAALVTRTNNGDGDQEDLRSEVEQLEDEYAAAIEAGDSAKVAKLHTKIAAKQAELMARRNAPKLTYDKGGETTTRETSVDKPATKKVHPKAARFMDANEDWWNDPECELEKAAVLTIDRQMTREGWTPDDDDYYDELKARFKQRIPDFDVSVPEVSRRRSVRTQEQEVEVQTERRTPAKPQQAKTVSPSVNRGQPTRVNTNGRVRLTTSDFDNMRRFGLDPENQQHVVEYATSVSESGGN